MEKTIYVELPCRLEGEEIVRISDELSRKLKEYQVLQEEKRIAMKAFNEQIARAEHDFMKLANYVNSREVTRAVRCRDVFEYNTATVMRIRTDTGEVVSKRAMEPEERQLELDSKTEEEDDRGEGDLGNGEPIGGDKEHERVSEDS